MVSKAEIVSHVWHGLAVGDNNLTVQMSTLRNVLGHGDGEPLVVTVPGRGYQFVGEVMEWGSGSFEKIASITTVMADAGGVATATAIERNTTAFRAKGLLGRVWRGLFVAAAGAALVAVAMTLSTWRAAPVAPRLSIAVLPFRNISPDHAQDYLADALTDDLTTDLAHIPSATVIARESVESLYAKGMSAQQIAQALHVRYLLLGSLAIEDSGYHLNAQLVDGTIGIHLWTQHFDVAKGGIGDVRTKIVRRLATSLDFQLAQIESTRSLHDRPSNPDALDMFFQARAILDWDRSLPGLTHAQRLLEKALMLQPDFSDAAAALGTLLLTKIQDMDTPNEKQDEKEARQAIEHALALAPRNSVALAAYGDELSVAGRWTEAAYVANEALALEPSNVAAEALLVKCAIQQGRIAEAKARIETLLSLTPISPLNNVRYLTLGYLNLIQEKVPEAMNWLLRASAGDDPRYVTESLGRAEMAQILLISAEYMANQVAPAQARYRRYSDIWPNRSVWRIRGYFPKALDALAGTQRVFQALADAGMPWFADEHDHRSLPEQACPGGDFDITPQSLSGARTIDSDELRNLISHNPKVLIIDVGRGLAVPSTAITYNVADTTLSEKEFALSVSGKQEEGKPTVVMYSGVFGCTGYLAAETLVQHGVHNVIWFRGGEEAWAAKTQPINPLSLPTHTTSGWN